MDTQILVIGGDARSHYLHNIFNDAGMECNSCLWDDADTTNVEQKLMNAGLVVLPANHMGGDVKGSTRSMKQSEIVSWMQEDAMLFCGLADEDLRALAGEANIQVYEFLQDECYLIHNAYLTAEGAVMKAIDGLDTSLVGAQCTVLGSGRIADALLHLLHPFTSHIRIAARNKAYLEACYHKGYTAYPLDEIEWALFGADVVFNTIPARVIGESDCKQLKHGSLYMELASKPYGCDAKDCPSGCIYSLQSSLPGRVSPYAAATAMAECIYRHTGVI